MRLGQASGVLYMGDERAERSVVDFQVSAEIAPNTARNFFCAGHPSADRALAHAEIARERCLPFLAVEENADLSKKKTIFAQEGVLPSSSAGPIPIRSKAAFCLVPPVRQGK
jgi:hypothetical protein